MAIADPAAPENLEQSRYDLGGFSLACSLSFDNHPLLRKTLLRDVAVSVSAPQKVTHLFTLEYPDSTKSIVLLLSVAFRSVFTLIFFTPDRQLLLLPF